LDRNKLVVKLNDQILKKVTMSQLNLNFEFDLYSYNVFEISQTGQILAIDLNKAALIHAKVPPIATVPEVAKR
jgi:hypothetical protein